MYEKIYLSGKKGDKKREAVYMRSEHIKHVIYHYNNMLTVSKVYIYIYKVINVKALLSKSSNRKRV